MNEELFMLLQRSHIRRQNQLLNTEVESDTFASVEHCIEYYRFCSTANLFHGLAWTRRIPVMLLFLLRPPTVSFLQHSCRSLDCLIYTDHCNYKARSRFVGTVLRIRQDKYALQSCNIEDKNFFGWWRLFDQSTSRRLVFREMLLAEQTFLLSCCLR
jgi:hypothetical protein